MKVALPILVATFLAGLLLGGGASVSTSGADPERRAPEPATTSDPQPPEPDPAPTDATTAVAVVSSDGGTVDPASLDGRLLAHVAHAMPPEVGRHHTIAGTVTDPSGRAVPGVTIRVQPIWFDLPGHGDTRENLQLGDFEKYMTDRAIEWRFVRSARREVVSEESGAFSIEDLPLARYRIEAVAPGDGSTAVIRVAGQERDSCYPGEDVRIECARDLRVAFEIVREDGTPFEGAKLTIGEVSLDWTATTAPIALPAGQHLVEVETATGATAKEVVTLRADRVTNPVRITIAALGDLVVPVRFPEGEESGHAQVWVVAVPPGFAPDAEWVLAHAEDSERIWEGNFEGEVAIRRASARTDGEVSFEDTVGPLEGAGSVYRELPPGEYAVAVGRTVDRPEQIATAFIAEGELTVIDFLIDPLSADEVLEVRVYDHLSRPLDDVEFELRVRGGPGYRHFPIVAARQPSGVYWVRLPADAWAIFDEPPGDGTQLVLHIDADGLQTRVPVDASVLEVFFSAPASLEVSLRGADPEREYAVVVSGGTGSWIESSEWDAEDGNAFFEGLQSGDVRVGVTTERGWSTTQLVDPVPFVLQPGYNALELEIPVTYTATIVLPEGVGGELLLFVVDAPLGAGASPEPIMGERDGNTAVFRDLTPGEYIFLRMEEMGAEFDSTRFTLERDVRIEHQSLPVRRVLIRFDEAGAPEGFPFRDRDVIVGIDGEEFTNLAEMMMLFDGDESTTLRFLVDRAGERIEVDAAAGLFELVMSEGGALIPVPGE